MIIIILLLYYNFYFVLKKVFPHNWNLFQIAFFTFPIYYLCARENLKF